MADEPYRDEHQQIRPRRLRDRGCAGGGACGLFQQDPHRAGAARGRRRPSGRARRRHVAEEGLGERVDRCRIRRARDRAPVGCAQRRAVRAQLSRAEGVAGTDPGRVRIDRRGHRRRAYRRSLGETCRGLHRPVRRRRHRILVSLRARAGFPPGAARGFVRRAAHRPGLTTAMLYRETGQFKTTYAADQQLFPIRQDRIGMAILLAVAFPRLALASVVPPAAGAIDLNYWFNGMLIPFLIFSLAALGLNIFTGYAGQLSLGTAAFMAVGASVAYNFEPPAPRTPLLASFFLAGGLSPTVCQLF